MNDDLGILDALCKVCLICLVCAAVVFGSLNLWSRYVRWYQQQIGMEAQQENSYDRPWLHAR